MTHCHAIVEELAANVANSEMLPIAFATSLRRTLEDVTGAVNKSGGWTDCGRGVPRVEERT